MANTNIDTSLFSRLKRLFSNGLIVTKQKNGQVRVEDPSHSQSAGNQQNSRFIDRYTRLMSNGAGAMVGAGSLYGSGYNCLVPKQELYSDYEAMDCDSIISSAIDIYADNTLRANENGNILEIVTDNPQIKDILENLFYNVLNINFNLWCWVRTLCKYGDCYLHLHFKEGLGIVTVTPLSSYYVQRLEGVDPNDSDHIQFQMIGDSSKTYEYYEIAHFRLLTDSNFLPYGKSILEQVRKVWKQIILMEDAMLIHRIMRAPEKRVFKVDVGNIPPNEVDTHMENIKTALRKTPYIDPQTGQYNLKFNLMNMLQDYFVPVRGGQSGTEIDTLGGMTFTGLEDINYLKGKLLAGLKVPKAFLNYDESTTGKATLAAEDVRFSKTIERIQRIILSELRKIALVHLMVQGFDNEDLLNFDLKMTVPSSLEEQERLTILENKINISKQIIDSNLLPREYIYQHIFNFTNDDMRDINSGLLNDEQLLWRLNAMQQSGQDPTYNSSDIDSEKETDDIEHSSTSSNNKQSSNTHTPKTKPVQSNNDAEPNVEDSYNPELLTKNGEIDHRKVGRHTPKVPRGGWKGAGRPREAIKYATNRYTFGNDPLGHKSYTSTFRQFRTHSENVDMLLKKYGLSDLVKNSKILNENAVIDKNK